MTPIGVFGFAITLVSMGASPAFADMAQLDEAVIAALNAGEPAWGKDARLTVAKAALVYWQEFDKRIPRNSPQDDEWLAREIQSRDARRIDRAINTPQYATDRLALLGSTCVAKFASLSDAVGVNPLVETYAWREAMRCYWHERQTMDFLNRVKLSDGKIDGSIPLLQGAKILDAAGGIEAGIANNAPDEATK